MQMLVVKWIYGSEIEKEKKYERVNERKKLNNQQII